MCLLGVPAVKHYEEEAVLNHLHGLQLAPTLRDLVPELVRREIEVAMSKLGMLYDRTYTWDIFSDMMVTLTILPLLFSLAFQLDSNVYTDVFFREVSRTLLCQAATCQSHLRKRRVPFWWTGSFRFM